MTKLGTPVTNRPGQWVQTERKAHQAWAALIARKPRAAMLLHLLVAHMGTQNAVVVSQKVLAQLMGKSMRTVQYAVADLVAERWISVVKLNGTGTVSAYVVNDQVAWGQARDQMRLSVFSAAVVADFSEQDEALLGSENLRRIPTLFPGEGQIPSGPDEDPPSQPSIEGLEPDLPSIKAMDVLKRAVDTYETIEGQPTTGMDVLKKALSDQEILETRGQQRLLEE